MTNLMTKASSLLAKASFKLEKNSPEILSAVGIAGIVVSAVMACKATLKAQDILEESKENLEKIEECTGNPSLSEEYTEEDAKKDTAIVYMQSGLKLTKLYAPAVILGILSLSVIITSNDILRKRNISLAAAYTTLNKSFKEYRGHILERFGEEAERKIRYNLKSEEIIEETTDENGQTKQTTRTETVINPNDELSGYARLFDECSSYWKKDSEYNLMFLRSQQALANDKLKTNGYLFLNDVYDMLDIPRTKAGQIVGWRYDLEHPSGDNYVDFGIYDILNERKRAFINGYERSILLNFNVDGDILHCLDDADLK